LREALGRGSEWQPWPGSMQASRAGGSCGSPRAGSFELKQLQWLQPSAMLYCVRVCVCVHACVRVRVRV